MIRALYSLLARGAQPLVRRKLRRRGVAEPGYLEAVGERFGRYATRAEPGALWIHAVSLGETRAAALLIDALRERDPKLRLLLTHGTATGRAEGAKLLRPGDQQAWQPWDTPEAVGAFLDHFRPRAGVLMETEVWPNLVAACAAHGLPLALANARLSDKSLRQAQRFVLLSRPAYRALSAVWAQTEADAQRLARAGARVSGVFGNLKFDARPDPGQLARGRHWRALAGRPVIMFASSREGEEPGFLAGLRALHEAAGRPDDRHAAVARTPLPPLGLLVPRHPQRFDAVAQMAREAGLVVSRRSAWGAEGPDADALSAQVWIGDSLGEMAQYYAMADVALLGGSFERLGGQNLIEAAACGCPVLMGPHTFNFEEASQQSEQAGAALRVPDLAQAMAEAGALVGDAPRREAMAAAAQAFAQAHRGAAGRTADAILAL